MPRDTRGWLPWTVAAILALALASGGWALWPNAVPKTQSLRFTLDPPVRSAFVFQFFSPSFSADGRYLVFSVGAESSRGSLWLRPVDSLEARQLPGTEGGDGTFWYPDGKSIGFIVENKLKRIEIQGGPPQTLCDVLPEYEGGSWSRDGVILFSNGETIRRVRATGGAATPVTALDPARIFLPFLSDGRRFLYIIQGRTRMFRGSMRRR